MKIKLFGLLEIDLAKIPRPERSGLISIITMFLLFGSVGVGGGEDPDLRCFLHPSKCVNEAADSDSHRHRLIFLYPGGRGPAVCTCHEDYRRVGAGEKEILHLRTSLANACDNDEIFFYASGDGSGDGQPVLVLHNNWMPASDGKNGKSGWEFRWHCEGEEGGKRK